MWAQVFYSEKPTDKWTGGKKVQLEGWKIVETATLLALRHSNLDKPCLSFPIIVPKPCVEVEARFLKQVSLPAAYSCVYSSNSGLPGINRRGAAINRMRAKSWINEGTPAEPEHTDSHSAWLTVIISYCLHFWAISSKPNNNNNKKGGDTRCTHTQTKDQVKSNP